MDFSDERARRNAATFRDANERILSSAREYEVSDAIPFLCECADPTCTAIVRLSAEEYGRIRSDSQRFFNAPGHSEPFLNGLEVVERHATYEIVENTGSWAIAGPCKPTPPP